MMDGWRRGEKKEQMSISVFAIKLKKANLSWN